MGFLDTLRQSQVARLVGPDEHRQAVYRAIWRHWRDHGGGLTLAELGAMPEFRDFAGSVSGHVQALCQCGLVEHPGLSGRPIRLLRYPDGSEVVDLS
jgi:hypothetical protein